MTQAHKGQILSLKNKVIPIDENTIFLAHYDLNEHDVLNGLKAIGNKKALYFNGANSISIDNPLAYQENKKQEWTVEAWVRLDSSGNGSTSQTLLNIDNGLQLEWGGGGQMLLYLNGGADDYYTYGSFNLKDDKWHHVAFVFRNSDGLRIIYVDGVNTNTSGPNNTSTPLGLEQTAIIGSGVKGYITDFRIWSKALSQSEIQSNMYRGITGDENSLLRYWRFDEGENDVLYESTVNSQDITFSGPTWSEGPLVATMRDDGCYGGGIAVEEPAVNVLRSTLRILDINNTWDCYDGIDAPYHTWGRHVDRAVIDNGFYGKYNSLRVFSLAGANGSSLGAVTWSGLSGEADGTNLTFSVYIKGVGSGVGQSIVMERWSENSTLGVQDSQGNFTLTSSWQRISLSWVNRVGDVNNLYLLVSSSDFQFEMALPQVERRYFATSPVDPVIATRDYPKLCYDPSVLVNLSEFTISFWVKPLKLYGGYQIIMRAGLWGTGGQGWGVVKQNGSNQVYFEYGIIDTSNTASAITPTDVLAENDWTFIAVVMSTTGVTIYASDQTGKLISSGEVASLPALNSYKYPITLGRDTIDQTSMIANAIFDELRIDRVARTEDEIQSWFYSQSPFYPKGIYKTI